MSRLVLLSAALGALLVPSALAQPDPDADPSAGTVELEGGFTPDPHAVDLTAGGGVEAASADAACPGYVDAAPSVVLDYDAGTGLPLHAFVRSSSDTVLLVRTPGGAWLCNDDDDGVNAGVYVEEPEGGRYAIWVGTYSDMEGGDIPVTLYFSEMEGPGIDPSGDPAAGTAALSSGFSPDPHEMDVAAGGPISMMAVEGCTGYVDVNAPTAVLDLDTDGALPLYVYARAESDDDLTLIVSGPDEMLHCNDDAEDLNPGLLIEAPQPGRYAVWVGTFSSRARTEDPVRATLYFSETEGPVAEPFDEEFMDDMDFVADSTYEGGEDVSLFAAPAHGTLTLDPGFSPDPREVEVEAGGGDAMSVMGAGCAGFITNGEPDVNVLYGEGGEGGVLAFSVSSDDDTTLLVNLPDGSWRCSDDEMDRNPAIVVEGPEAGLYNVWVGTFSQETGAGSATLRISGSGPR